MAIVPRRRWQYADLAPPRLSLPVWAMVSFGLLAASLFADEWGMRLQSELPPVVVLLFQSITRWGQADWLLIPTGLLLLWIYARRQSVRDARLGTAVLRVAGVAGLVFAAVAFTGLISLATKYLIGRERPGNDGQGLWHFIGPNLNAYYSAFPSGHSTTMGTLAILAFVLLKGWPRITVITFAFLVTVSRVVIGAHHVSDATAGALLGLWGGWWMIWIFARLEIAVRANNSPVPQARPLTWPQFVAAWRGLWPRTLTRK